MNQDEPVQEPPEPPVEPEPTSTPEAGVGPQIAPASEAGATPEADTSPLQSLRLPSVRHPVLPWMSGEKVAVVNPGLRLWYVGMFREPLITALIAVAVTVVGGATQLALNAHLDIASVLASAPIIGLIVFCFSTGIPSEIRITTDGVGVLDWREAAHDWPGRFFPTGAQPQFRMIASGTYLTAPAREPVRVRLPRFAIARAARLSGLRLERSPSWWIWMLLSWPGLFLWCALPFQSLGGAMMLMGLAIRTFSRLGSGEAEEDLLVHP